jgi:ABC-type uncharacterized transport system permease subunit
MTATWISLAIALLKLSHSLVGWLHRKQMIKAGEDSIIASTALAILDETQTGKELRAYIDNMEEGEALALWDRMLKHE